MKPASFIAALMSLTLLFNSTILIAKDYSSNEKVIKRISKYGDNNTPYPLYGHIWTSGMEYNEKELQTIAHSFDYLIGNTSIPTKKFADRLRQIDPRFQVILYTGGWGEHYDRIGDKKMDLTYYKCGTLDSDIDANSNKITIHMLKPSEGGGIMPSIKGKYDVWIRVDNELMKVLRISQDADNNVSLSVERAFCNTSHNIHKANAVVTLPVYCTKLDPNINSKKIKYFIDCYDFRHDKIVKAAVDAISNLHCDGVWIDILNGRLGARSILGKKFQEWDYRTNAPMKRDNDIKYTKEAINSIACDVKKISGKYPMLYGNNVVYSQILTTDSRAYVMVHENDNLIPLQGYCHENSFGHMGYKKGEADNDGEQYSKDNAVNLSLDNDKQFTWVVGDSWVKNCQAIALLSQKGLPNQPMSINAGFKNKWYAELLSDDYRYKFDKYAYASYLMCVDVAPDSTITTRYGFSPQVNKSGKVTINISDFFYYPIGIPVDNYSATNFLEYKHPGLPLYVRKFTNGVVIINSTKENMAHDVAISDLLGENVNYYDPKTNKILDCIKLNSTEVLILLKK